VSISTAFVLLEKRVFLVVIDHKAAFGRILSIFDIMVFHNAFMFEVATPMKYAMNRVIYPGMNNFPGQ
jgi:hypothetical protein